METSSETNLSNSAAWSAAPGGSPAGPLPCAWLRGRRRSQLRKSVALATRPGVLSLAGGLPAYELLPRDALARVFADVLEASPTALGYRPESEELKQRVVERMAARGVSCSADQIVITTGAQQGLDVLARALLERGRGVLMEEVSYSGAVQAIAAHRPRVWPVPTCARAGIDVDTVEELLERGVRPAFLYTVPDFHNPTGSCLGEASRRRLADLAGRFELPLIEDDPYSALRFDGDALPAVRAFDERWVIYVGTFSKIIAPALRVGWIVVPHGLREAVSIVKETSDLETSALSQRVLARFLSSDAFEPYLDRLRHAYRERRDAMLGALERDFPSCARWNRPRGGLFVWVELPPSIRADRLLVEAVDQEGVAFIPGSAFATTGEAGASAMRLSFATCAPARIEEAVRRLARVLKGRLGDE